MAGRSSTNVSSSVNQDFQPQCEQKEEPGANILLVHLPGFRKEQLRVTYVDSSRTIKVHGEGAVEKSRRSRFNQAFPVPQNCIIDKIHANFTNGVLTITMPKRTITQVVPAKDAKATKETVGREQKPVKDQKEAPSTSSGFDEQKDQKLQPPQTPQKPITQPENAPPKAHTNGKNAEQQETEKKVAPTATTTEQTQENTAGSTAEIVEKKAETEAVLRNQNSTMSGTNIPKMSEKGGSSSIVGKAQEIKGMDTIMKSVKGVATDGYGDGQLLINIGVSLLVIVALGAYIAYTFRSSGKAKN